MAKEALTSTLTATVLTTTTTIRTIRTIRRAGGSVGSEGAETEGRTGGDGDDKIEDVEISDKRLRFVYQIQSSCAVLAWARTAPISQALYRY